MYKIVIIDDEPMVLKGLTTLVPWYEIGCEIVGMAENGEEGLALIQEKKPDVVISDIQMPKLSGLDMIRQIYQAKMDVKCILLTGYRQFEYAKEAINLGIQKFLLKPTNLEEIKAAVIEMTQLLDDERSKEETVVALQEKLAALERPKEQVEEIAEKGEEGQKVKYLVRQAIDFMKLYYSEKIELQTVADHLYISTWYVCKLFKQELNTSFIEILNEIRIQEAKRLLLETNKKIYEICEEVGYNDNPYFTKTFKKFTGKTPNQYRNQ